MPIAKVEKENRPEYKIDAKGHFKTGSCCDIPLLQNIESKVIRDLLLKWLFDSGSGLDVIGLDELNEFLVECLY